MPELTSTVHTVVMDLDTAVFDSFHAMRCAVTALGLERPELVLEFDRALGENPRSAPHPEALRVLSEPTVELASRYDTAFTGSLRLIPRVAELLARLNDANLVTLVRGNGSEVDAWRTLAVLGAESMVDGITDTWQHGSGTVAVLGLRSTGRPVRPPENVPWICYTPTGTGPVGSVKCMGEVISLLGLAPRPRRGGLATHDSGVRVQDLGADLVAVPQHCLDLGESELLMLARLVAATVEAACGADHVRAAHCLIDLIELIGAHAAVIDSAGLRSQRPAQPSSPLPAARDLRGLTTISRSRSLAFHYTGPLLRTADDHLGEVVTKLQQALDLLEVDYPRAACRQLRAALLALGHAVPELGSVDVRGEGLEQVQS